MIFVGEAFRAEVWPDVRIKGYKFYASESGLMGVYVRNDLDAKVTVTFPDDPRLVDRLAVVKGTLNGEPVTVYGTYAINMHARSPQHTKGSPKARKDYDEALFKEVKKPFDGQEGALVALLGDMNTVWSRENVVCGANGEWKAKSDRNQHALVLARWKNALLEPFGEPLGDGAWTYKHIEERDPNRARCCVDYAFVSPAWRESAKFARLREHNPFLNPNEEGNMKYSDHVPISVVLKMGE